MKKQAQKNTSLNKETLKLYWQQISQHKFSFFCALITIPSSFMMIDTILPFLASQAIGNLGQSSSSDLKQNLIYATIAGTLGVLLNFIGFQALVRHEANVRHLLSIDTFEKLISKDLAFFNNTKLGGLTSKYLDFLNSEVAMQDLLIMRTLGLVLSVGSGLVILWSQMWQLAMIFIIFLTLLIAEIKWSVNKRKPWRESRRQSRSMFFGDLADAIGNSVIVKTFGGEKKEVTNIRHRSGEYKKLFLKDAGFVATEGSVRNAILVVFQVAAIGISGYLVSNKLINIGVAIFVLAYIQRLGSQIFALGQIINGFDQSFLDAGPLTKILLSSDQIVDKPNAPKLKVTKGLIEFKSASYRYPEKKALAINNLNLIIKPGEKIGIIGMSGAGKTTLVELLLRFFDLNNGQILIDGQDISQVSQQSLRQTIAYVPQDPALFHRSLKDNIAYGYPGASQANIINAAKKANAWEFIQQLPDKLDTLVGERGVKLSGGQRQRIAIARAIVKNAPILILDEATSALDSESEKLIQDSVDALMHNRTSIVIAHRLSTINKLDRIVVLDKGQIAESGSHQQLISQNGIYAKLWKRQSGGFLDDDDDQPELQKISQN